MRLSAADVALVAGRRPGRVLARFGGRWRPVVRVSLGLLPNVYPQNRTVYLGGVGAAFVEDDMFDVRLAAQPAEAA